ncbi:hypothetical protein GCM10010448_64070 [Streptomyces glomeratus]|uniref:Uncharacterized protein n=1 Tax=Streptomyces glomeratus TaxID=284452 RepID=A0ABP6M4L7_9ACTN
MHQLPGGRATGRGQGVAGVPEIMETDAIEAGRCEGTEPDPPEVVPPQDTTPGAEEDKPGSAGRRQ